jgi:hypothetical protein
MTAAMLPVALLATTLAQQGPAVLVPASLTGEWTLVGEESFGRLSNDGRDATVSLSGLDRDSEAVVRRYRCVGKRGEAFTFEQVGQSGEDRTRAEVGSAALPSRAYLLSVAPTVALWWLPHREAFLAYRKQSIPARFRGSYLVDKHPKDVEGFEVGADTVKRIGAGLSDDEPRVDDGEEDAPRNDTIPVVAVAHAGPESLRLVLGGVARGDRLHIDLHGQRATLVRERSGDPDSTREAKLTPARQDKADKGDKGEVLKPPASPALDSASRTVLPIGLYRLSSLSGNDESLLVASGVQWSIFPFSGEGGTVFYGEVAGTPTENAVYFKTIGPGSGRDHVLLHRLEGDNFLFERDRKVRLLHRMETPPPWAPTAGLTADVKRLCVELAAAGPNPDERTIGAAFQRMLRAARSDLMRTLAEVLAQVPHDRRGALLEKGLEDAGEPIPACPGVDLLRTLR